MLNALATEPIENIQQAPFFSLGVFFGIEATVHGERTALGDHVKIGASAEFAAHHQDRAARRLWTDRKRCFALLDFAFQLFDLASNYQHAFECVDALIA